MTAPQGDFLPLRLSTESPPIRDRATAWRDFFSPKLFGGRVEAVSGEPLHSDMTVLTLPGVRLMSGVHSSTRFSRNSADLGRLAPFVADPDDAVMKRTNNANEVENPRPGSPRKRIRGKATCLCRADDRWPQWRRNRKPPYDTVGGRTP